jgi:NADH-quinone oxidoreductase subunit A
VESEQIVQYLPVLILCVVAVGLIAFMLGFSTLIGKRGDRPPIKDTAYECGMLPIGSGNTRFSVKFFVVAMLFILFDIEVVFLYPWAVVYKEMLKTQPNVILGAMLSFIAVLFIAYLYALKKGAFQWSRYKPGK